MSARWEQFVFGKLVQRPGGPIVGADHGCTARSPGFPKGLVLTAHPGHTGIGIGTSFDWNKYPWQDTPGGFVARPVHDGDQAWVLAGRMRARPEDGEGCTGRRYTQAHYAAVPAEHWRPTALVALLPQLTTVPATEKDHQLPTLETDAPTLELPANWLQTITPILETVMSGHGISIQNWNTTPDEQVCLLAVCLSALPTSLAWRLDIGAGVVDMDGSFAIAHGMRAVKGVRIFKGERRGVEALDLSAGRAYVEWLRTVVDDCHSTEQLRQRIASLEHFDGWDAIPHTEGWVPAAGAIGAAMLEREILASLERWLTGATHHPPAVAQLQHMRPLAIKMALDHAESPGAWVLCDMLDPSWDQAWASAAEFAGERHLALATLLGKHGAPTSAHLAEMATVELPAEVVRLVVPNLEPLIRGAGRERDMTQWTALVRAAKADWAKTWVDGASACLLWLAHSEVDRPAASGLLAAISDTAAMRIVQQLQDRQVPGDDGLAWLARGLAMEPPHQAALDDMLGRIWAAGNPIGATRLALCAEQHGVGSRLLDTLQSPDLVRSAGLSTLAKQLAVATLQATSVAPKDVVRCVLLGWAHLADAQRDALIDVWIDRLEPAAALVLFGRHGQRAGDPSLLEVAREAAIVRLRADGESRSRLMSLFHDGDRPGPVRAGAAELARHLVQQDPTYWSQDAVLAALGVLYERRPPGGGARLGGADLASLGRLLRALERPPPIEPLMELADDEPTLRQRFLALNCQERVALNVQQLAWVLQATIFGPQGAGKAWVQVVRSGGWGTRLGWRLVAAASSDAAADIERLTPTETAAVAQLGRLGTLHLAARCVPVPEPSLWEIGPSDLSQAQLTAQGAHRVAGLLKSAKGDRVRRLLAVHLVAGLKHSSHPRQKVEALLLGSEGFITGFKRALGFEATPPESVQVLRTLCEGQPRDAVLTIIEEGWSDALLR